MSTLSSDAYGSFVPTPADTELARAIVPRLTELLASDDGQVTIQSAGASTTTREPIVLPASAVEILSGILKEVAKGNSVSVVPTDAELTTQQAADLIRVSRPFLIDQLERGTIPFRKVGAHRRVLFRDLIAYKQSMDRNRRQALDNLASDAQSLNMGY